MSNTAPSGSFPEPDWSDALRDQLKSRFAAAHETVARATAWPTATTSTGPVSLSAVQRRLWFLAQLEPENPAYHVPSVFRLSGQLNEAALLGALRDLAERHLVLRGVIDADGPEPVVRTRPAADVPVVALDVSEEDLDAALAEETGRPFRLTAEPPMRAVLFRLPDFWVLALTVHHIAIDGWSQRIVLSELKALYTARCGDGEPLPPAPQYADVVGDEAEDPAGLDWWTGHLAGLPPVLDLPSDRPRTLASAWPGGATAFAVPSATTARLRTVAAELGVSPFMVLMAAWQALLGRLAGTDDVAVGVPHAGRHTAASEAAVGCFLDTIVLRTDLTGEPSGRDLVSRVRAGALDAFSHARTPFERIVQRLHPERTLSATPVFQVLLNVYDETNAPALPGVRAEWLHVPPQAAKFDLNMELADGGPDSGFSGGLIYRRDLFDPRTAENLVRWFLTLLAGMVADPERPVGEIPLEPVAGPALAGPRTEPAVVPVHTLMERWADERPDTTAVVGADGRLTYREWELRANRLAHRLIALGVRPDQPVGILLDPGCDFATAVFGILKAGGAYLPMDTTYPASRVRDMLRASGARLVVTAGEPAERVRGLADVVEPVTAHGAGPESRPTVSVAPDNLAHVIFTSGSTGAPKGVAVQHGNLAHCVTGLVARMPQAAGGSFAMVSTVAADLGLACLYGAWLTGGTLHLMDRETATDPQAYARYLARHQVDVVKLVPSHLTMLADHGDLAAVLPGKLLILGGEGCPWSLVEQVRRLRPDLAVHTHYGPTEATMMSLICDVDEVPEGARTRLVPLGRPLPNVTGLVVDRSGRPQPTGVPGELLLGGPGVARGYVGRPDLTTERFVDDPEGGRWYRTGDLVRLRDGDVVEFLGRTDDQVKVRGYRVELGEVTAALRALPEVADAVVLPEGEAHRRRLACWVVPAPGHAPQPDAIRARLRESLADYLVPADIVVLDRIPLTANGKPDRAALREAPKPAEPERAKVAPNTPAEKAVAQAWAAVLGAPRIGADDDFFALGGHSFAATRLVGMLAEATGCRLPVRVVFERPVLRELAAELARRMADVDTPAPVIQRRDPGSPAQLSSAQERLWFLWRLRPDSDAYNTVLALRLTGPLDADALCAAVRDLAARHEVLRTVVAESDAGPRAVAISPDAVPATVVEVDASGVTAALRAETTRSFALDREPPFRASVLRISATEHLLVLTAHHIAVDAWSATTILDDLGTLYGARRGTGPAPEPLDIQYVDVTEWQRSRHGLPGTDEHLDWWSAQLHDLSPLTLPQDRQRGPATGWAGAAEPVVLPPGLTARLRGVAAKLDCTPFMVLLTTWQALLARLADVEDVPVGVPVSGRSLPGTERMVGCFANTLVLRGDLSGDPTVREALLRTRTRVLAALDHAETPFEEVVDRLRPDRDPDSTPLFQAMLNVLDLPPAADRFADLIATRVDSPRTNAQVDLLLTLVDDGTGFAGSLTYRAGLFDATTVRRWARWFVGLLDAALREPDQPVLGLDPPLSAGERAEQRSAATGAPLPQHQPVTVVAAVLDQARRRPDAVAVLAADGVMNYGELDRWSNRVGAALLASGVRPGDAVGVCLPRGRLLPAALLAVLRAGAAYVPLDPEYPAERLARLAVDARVRVVLSVDTTAVVARALPHVTAIEVDSSGVDEVGVASGHAELPHPDPQAVAYILFTSGSTGRPKGVAVTHANLAAFVAAMRAEPGMNQDDVTLGVVPFTFDVFGYELWVTLSAGARLALADRDTAADGRALANWIERTGVTVATATPTTLRILMAAEPPRRPVLRVISIGEVLDPTLARDLSQRIGELWNAYGPTETTIYSTMARVDEPVGDGPVSIGRPIAGTRVHVMDRRNRPTLPGGVGELWIAGAGVANGYLGQAGLTADRFVIGPDGERCYRTGDLVRWRGRALEYLARTDHQVKVRGHRIEPGEIEAALRGHSDVADAVVTVLGRAGEHHLVGYVVARNDGLAGPLIEAYLRDRLPEYMVPRRWVFLDAVPVTANGKVDRAALPAPGEPERTVTAPRTLMEQLVAKVWSDVLHIRAVGREDDFFALGGDSLAATRMAGRLGETLGEVPVRAIFDRSVLADFAGHLQQMMLDRLAAEPGGEQP
ncbi:amino acid adenylation domain-containing protein [Micromonospora sp. NPDC050417]|uniref:amino acid adenylation domain-containing protein n=1 Tax=Micromonospora sp. NPDC050417 TaxID=3364280 RepID=UPI0037883C84